MAQSAMPHPASLKHIVYLLACIGWGVYAVIASWDMGPLSLLMGIVVFLSVAFVLAPAVR